MEIKANNVYVNKDGDFFKAAMTGNFIIVDCWPCDKEGYVKDIKENPSPVPVNTIDFCPVGEAEHFNYYPKPEINFKSWRK